MRYSNWKNKNKINPSKNNLKHSRGKKQNKNEMKTAFHDEKELKKKKKRLTIDWFFRPKGD